MDNIVEVKNLSFDYEENVHTINDISFSIKKGSYTSILGHNGSGKSTIAKLLIGLLEAKTGEIKVNNIILNSDNIYKIREQVGIVFQNPDNQFIGSTVKDDIAFGLENICVDPSKMDDIIDEYAKKVHMEDFLDHEPTKLSGGQKQRVAIAGILAMSPSLIILDESTSMLDPKGKKDINELVRSLNKEKNMSILSITHDIEEAALSDHIIVLNKGKVVTTGTPDEILSNVKMLNELSLDTPFAYKISSMLNKEGFNIDKTINKEKLVESICQLNLNK